MRGLTVLVAAALIGGAAVTATTAGAHDGVRHTSVADARQHAAQTSSAPVGPDTIFPVNLGGDYRLTDHTGAVRTQADPGGKMQLVFFGYANCQAICSVALPLMAEVTDKLEGAVQPVMITVDPARDTVDTMGPALARHHGDFVGLTGSEAELQPVYDLFQVDHKVVFEDPELGPVFAHGSHIYLMNAAGDFMTLMPPILSADRVAEIIESYAVE